MLHVIRNLDSAMKSVEVAMIMKNIATIGLQI